MKSQIKHLAHRVTLAAILASPNLTPAQTFTTLHAFAGGGDGANPWGTLVLSGNTLYGTTFTGGVYVSGTIFSINTDGSGFTNFYHFTGGSDGANPYAGLILSGNTLYGTTSYDGEAGSGTVFKVNTDGSGFTPLHQFTGGNDGGKPWAGLTLIGDKLFGTAQIGGTTGQGIVFAVKTDGTGFTNLHSFSGSSDGSSPYAGLIPSGNVLYGTTQSGGAAGDGTVFAINTNGTGFTNLYSFTATSGANSANGDGAAPWAGLNLIGDTLFGLASGGGSSGSGTLFSINTNSTGFKPVYTFTATSGPLLGNNDGATPVAPLTLSGDTFYGTAEVGGNSGSGTVFMINTNGTGFRTLYNFAVSPGLNAPNQDGAYPVSKLILSGNALYGTTYAGGTGGFGAIFSLSLPAGSVPELSIASYASNIVLTWPASSTGFTLQSTADLTSPVWSVVSPAPNVVNGLNTVTNPISGNQRFYRLSQ